MFNILFTTSVDLNLLFTNSLLMAVGLEEVIIHVNARSSEAKFTVALGYHLQR